MKPGLTYESRSIYQKASNMRLRQKERWSRDLMERGRRGRESWKKQRAFNLIRTGEKSEGNDCGDGLTVEAVVRWR